MLSPTESLRKRVAKNIIHDLFLIVFLMSEDVQHVPRCTVYGQASLSESDYTHTPHADMIWSWCQTKGTLIVHIPVGVYTASVLSANSHRNPRWCIPLPVSCN